VALIVGLVFFLYLRHSKKQAANQRERYLKGGVNAARNNAGVNSAASGRNAPCACGSGKKNKFCCGS